MLRFSPQLILQHFRCFLSKIQAILQKSIHLSECQIETDISMVSGQNETGMVNIPIQRTQQTFQGSTPTTDFQGLFKGLENTHIQTMTPNKNTCSVLGPDWVTRLHQIYLFQELYKVLLNQISETLSVPQGHMVIQGQVPTQTNNIPQPESCISVEINEYWPLAGFLELSPPSDPRSPLLNSSKGLGSLPSPKIKSSHQHPHLLCTSKRMLGA